MIIFERFEDKKFEIKTLEDLDKLNIFSIEELKDEQKYIETIIENNNNKEVIDEYTKLHSVIDLVITTKETPSKEEIEQKLDEMYLPDYRKDGYFNSNEFKEIEKEVDNYISTLEGINPNNYELLKEEILRNKYNINWLPIHKRFVPKVQVIVD